jgi:hypothetical protein
MLPHHLKATTTNLNSFSEILPSYRVINKRKASYFYQFCVHSQLPSIPKRNIVHLLKIEENIHYTGKPLTFRKSFTRVLLPASVWGNDLLKHIVFYKIRYVP